MKVPVARVRNGGHRKATRSLTVGLVFLAAFGIYEAKSLSEFASFLLIVSAAMFPSFLWVRSGAEGVPVLPAFAGLHALYYAFPVVRSKDQLFEYGQDEVGLAAVTVAAFLLAATAGCEVVSRQVKGAVEARDEQLPARELRFFVFAGLGLGLGFHGAVIVGFLAHLGPAFGVVRAVFVTAMSAACFFLGTLRARKQLKGGQWALALLLLGLSITLSLSSLFLVGSASYLLAAGLGFMISARRVPWFTLACAFVVISILHAGKAEMRHRYWLPGANYGGVSSPAQVPEMLIEWTRLGLRELEAGRVATSAIDRTSLIHLLLRGQRSTPSQIDYIRGETYALIPSMLVPRFLSPEKTASQAGMQLLNVKFGVLTAEGAMVTAVGWGLIAEAWVNLGFVAVVTVGLLLGAATGALTRWSAGASALSRPTLLSITTMSALMHMEADLGGLVTTILQSSVATLIFLAAFRLLIRRRSRIGAEPLGVARVR